MPSVVTLYHLTFSLLRQDRGPSHAHSIVREGDALIEVTYPLVRTVTPMMEKWFTVARGHISSL